MNHFLYILTFLTPFTVYGVFKFIRWWIQMIWQRQTDIHNSPDSWFASLTILPFIYWSIFTIDLFDEKLPIPPELLFVYWVAFFFGPFTHFLAFIRIFNFGNTKLGKSIGCHPPTVSKTC